MQKVVSREEWLVARKALLAREKKLTHLRDELSAERRNLPRVAIDKPYAFEGPDGKETLPNCSAATASCWSITSCSIRSGWRAALAVRTSWIMSTARSCTSRPAT